MMPVAPAILDLAEQILAQEDRVDNSATAPLRVFERLSTHLVKYFGLGGYLALLNRALALSAPQATLVGNLRVRKDGALEMAEGHASGEAAEGALIFLAHLLELLVTFVGEALTLRLVQDVWPHVTLKLSLNSSNAATEVTP